MTKEEPTFHFARYGELQATTCGLGAGTSQTSMQNQNQIGLRIFLEETVSDPCAANVPGLNQLCKSFASLTGWTLAYHETSASRTRREGVGCRNLPLQGRLSIDDLADDAIRGSMRAANREKCDQMVTGLNLMLEELDRGRDEIWRQNAELATGIPVTDDGSAAEKLAVLLNSLLTSAVDVTNARQAALYLLDDGTQNLNLRTQVGFGQAQLPANSRDLSKAKADLEALLGHVVAMEDAGRFASWDIPAECGAAVCVPVSSTNNLLGTLWIFDAKPRDFTGLETNMLEIVSGRIAAELERNTLLRIARDHKQLSVASAALSASIPRPQLPNIPPPIDELKVRGFVSTAEQEQSAGAVYDWAICKQGRLAFLVAHAQGQPSEAARVATILQTAFRAHAGYCPTALELFDSVFETSMSVGSGDNPVRFTCGYFEPGSGDCELASTEELAGTIAAIGDEFQLAVGAGTNVSGEFGLAHVAKVSLQQDEEFTVALCAPHSSTPIAISLCGETNFADVSNRTSDSDDAPARLATIAALKIKRVG